MKNKKWISLAAAVIFAVTALPATVFAAKNGESKEELTKVTLNEVAHSIFYAPQYVAIEEGYFAEEGLDLTLVTAAAFTGDMSADFTVEFEPSATALEKEGKGYVVASLGVDSGYVPYNSYSAKTSFLNENPQIIQSFTNALQKGMDYVQSHSPEEIAQVISPQFPETDMDTLTTIVKRYYEQDTWKENLIFEKDSFELLQDILESAGELSDRADCENLVTTAFAEAAIS